MWLPGEFDGQAVAYLFSNGQQIANSEGNAGTAQSILTEGESENIFRDEYWLFRFYKARLFDNNGDYKDAHIFKQNPGNYDIKFWLPAKLREA